MDIEKQKESMPRCKDCTGFGWGECKTAGENEVACKDFERKPKLTNGDRIRQMTDEELAECLDHVAGCGVCVLNEGKYRYSGDHCGHEHDCMRYIEKWLKQEVSEDATD